MLWKILFSDSKSKRQSGWRRPRYVAWTSFSRRTLALGLELVQAGLAQMRRWHGRSGTSVFNTARWHTARGGQAGRGWPAQPWPRAPAGGDRRGGPGWPGPRPDWQCPGLGTAPGHAAHLSDALCGGHTQRVTPTCPNTLKSKTY